MHRLQSRSRFPLYFALCRFLGLALHLHVAPDRELRGNAIPRCSHNKCPTSPGMRLMEAFTQPWDGLDKSCHLTTTQTSCNPAASDWDLVSTHRLQRVHRAGCVELRGRVQHAGMYGDATEVPSCLRTRLECSSQQHVPAHAAAALSCRRLRAR